MTKSLDANTEQRTPNRLFFGLNDIEQQAEGFSLSNARRD